MPDNDSIILPQKEARRRYTAAGLSLARSLAEDPDADPWRISVETYHQLVIHRKPLKIPKGYDPDKHRDVGRCCS